MNDLAIDVSRTNAQPTFTIDSDKNPILESGWEIREHRKGGGLEWDKKAQGKALWSPPRRQNGRRMSVHDLREELRGMPVLNASVHDNLFANQERIPEEWKPRKGKIKVILFLDTEFGWSANFGVPRSDYRFVRCLCETNGKWLSHYVCLHYPLKNFYYAALRAG